MKLDSTTYHYQAKPDGHTEWPVTPKLYAKTIHFLPDTLSFDIHVTAWGNVTARNIYISGQRVLKEGLSQHRVHERYNAAKGMPTFVLKYVANALELHQA